MIVWAVYNIEDRVSIKGWIPFFAVLAIGLSEFLQIPHNYIVK